MDNKLCKCGHSEYQHMIAGDFECCHCFCKKFQSCESEPEPEFNNSLQADAHNWDTREIKCQCGHKWHDNQICWDISCNCHKSQPCVEPEPTKDEAKHGAGDDLEPPNDSPETVATIIANLKALKGLPASPVKDRIVLTTDLTCNCGEQMRRDLDSANAQLPAIIARAKRELAREFIPLVEKLFEALSHADFSNGNEEYGVDEGREQARVFIKDLSDQFEALKSKYIPEEK
jgi:hypothetical protein